MLAHENEKKIVAVKVGIRHYIVKVRLKEEEADTDLECLFCLLLGRKKAKRTKMRKTFEIMEMPKMTEYEEEKVRDQLGKIFNYSYCSECADKGRH